MNEEQIREGLESGILHPFPLLQHLAREGDEDGARFVAEVGSEYLQGKERLRFRGLVRELVPEVFGAEEAERAERSERKRQEQTSALGDSLKAKVAAKREKRLASPMPSGQPGGWNLPLEVRE
jgi:hypothetical protein